MSNRVVRSVLVLAGLLAIGCDGGGASTDAGVDGHVHAEDGGANDGGTDAGPTPCGDTFCTSDEACVRGVCVAHCGSDASSWDAALAEGLVPVTSICRPAAARAVHASGDTVDVWDVTTSTSGSETTFVLSRWPLSAPTPVEVARTTTDPGADAMVFAGGYLALSPTAAWAAYGYTVSPSFDGEVYLVANGAGVAAELSAPGNFDAAFLDEVLLVNGMGVGTVATGGQGLYAVVYEGGAAAFRVAEGLGVASGGVRVTDTFVLVGALFEGFEGRAYVIDRALVQDVLSAGRALLNVSGEAGTTPGIHLVPELPSTFTLVDELVVVQEYDESFALLGLRAYPILGYDAATGLSLGAREALTSGAAFDGALPAGEGRMLLTFAGGVLLVER